MTQEALSTMNFKQEVEQQSGLCDNPPTERGGDHAISGEVVMLRSGGACIGHHFATLGGGAISPAGVLPGKMVGQNA